MRKELMSYFGELSSTRLQVFAGRRLPTATFFRAQRTKDSRENKEKCE